MSLFFKYFNHNKVPNVLYVEINFSNSLNPVSNDIFKNIFGELNFVMFSTKKKKLFISTLMNILNKTCLEVSILLVFLKISVDLEPGRNEYALCFNAVGVQWCQRVGLG